jgi:hypothetical protein
MRCCRLNFLALLLLITFPAAADLPVCLQLASDRYQSCSQSCPGRAIGSSTEIDQARVEEFGRCDRVCRANWRSSEDACRGIKQTASPYPGAERPKAQESSSKHPTKQPEGVAYSTLGIKSPEVRDVYPANCPYARDPQRPFYIPPRDGTAPPPPPSCVDSKNVDNMFAWGRCQASRSRQLEKLKNDYKVPLAVQLHCTYGDVRLPHYCCDTDGVRVSGPFVNPSPKIKVDDLTPYESGPQFEDDVCHNDPTLRGFIENTTWWCY